MTKTWQAVESQHEGSATARIGCSAVLKLIDQKNPPPRVTVGDTFQSLFAPLIFRALPQSVRLWGLKKYYGI